MENEGRTFEKAEVVEILQDNIQESGTRTGQQSVKLKIRTGEHKGEIVEATSTSSYLYGADCTVGLKVIAIISEYGDSLSASVYNYDRGNMLYGIVAFFLVMLWLIGGKKGLNSALGLVFTFVCIIFLIFTNDIPRVLSDSLCNFDYGYYNRCSDVFDRWYDDKNDLCHSRNYCRSNDFGIIRLYFWKAHTYFRV